MTDTDLADIPVAPSRELVTAAEAAARAKRSVEVAKVRERLAEAEARKPVDRQAEYEGAMDAEGKAFLAYERAKGKAGEDAARKAWDNAWMAVHRIGEGMRAEMSAVPQLRARLAELLVEDGPAWAREVQAERHTLERKAQIKAAAASRKEARAARDAEGKRRVAARVARVASKAAAAR